MKSITTPNRREQKLLYGMLLSLSLVCSTESIALGVPAGTIITNTVTVTYLRNENDTAQQHIEASDSFTVAETINASLTSLDTPAVVTPTPANNRILSFQLTNTGNGTETYALQSDNLQTGDQFNPNVENIWIESNGTPEWQNTDTQYQRGTNDVALDSDESRNIYIISSIPQGLNINDQGGVRLTATSTTKGIDTREVGGTISNVGTNNTGVVLLIRHGKAGATGYYIVSPVQLELTKQVVSITDPYSRDSLIPGSLVTYQIDIEVTGTNGLLQELVIEDPTPDNMTYVTGSIKIDGKNASDTVDNDNADFGISKANTVTLNLGDVIAPATHKLTITYKIN